MSNVHGFAGEGLGGGSSVEETEEESDDDDIGEEEPPSKQVALLQLCSVYFSLFPRRAYLSIFKLKYITSSFQPKIITQNKTCRVQTPTNHIPGQGNLDLHGNPSWFSGLQDEMSLIFKLKYLKSG